MSVTGVFTRNWRLKIAALAFAVLLWVTMSLSDESITLLSIPDVEVRVDQLDPEWLLQGQPSPNRIEMTVTGPFGELFRLAMAEPFVVIPVASVEEEDLVLELNPDWVRNVDRSSVAIEGFAPSTIRLLFERRREEEIPVSTRVIGRLPDSLALVSEPRPNLLFARVRGPASLLDPLETVFLEPFDLAGLTGSGRFDVALDTVGLGALAVSPTTATLTVEVARKTSWAVGQRAVGFTDAGEDWIVEPESLNVTLLGAEVRLSTVDLDAIRLEVAADPAAVRVAVEQDGEARVPVAVTGVPRWVEGVAEADSVTIRKAGPP